MDVFAVLAYRGCNRSDYGYVVGVFDTEGAALAAALWTDRNRGGKYECEVLRMPQNHVHDGFDVPAEVVPLDEPRPVHREPDPLRDGVTRSAENSGARVIEVRVTTLPDVWNVSLIFDNGTTSACFEEFPTRELAESFAVGLRNGLEWQAKLILAGIKGEVAYQEEHSTQVLDADDVAEMIERYLKFLSIDKRTG